jgi:hypothetical protein
MTLRLRALVNEEREKIERLVRIIQLAAQGHVMAIAGRSAR